ETPKLAAGERVRIIQLTDLHIRHGGLREWRVIELVRGLEPDLILHAGDFWGARGSENPTAELLRSWSVPQYTCMGNADRLPALSEVMRNGGVTILNGTSATETVRGTRLTIAGFPPEDRPRMKNALKQLPADTFNILLCHYPCGFLETWGTPVDLMLAGHTHGGQIRLPWYGALITLDPTGKRYESGFFHERGVYLSVSRGIGCEPGIPEARFLCPPEIVCIDLVGKP
ncbi:MAG: uncharacterized protein QG656_1989, partial [Candidatus Hydrogenedentes bacterium]|nr:uncharacterized protein [Candidatus Hydrogenedentota bacterium]